MMSAGRRPRLILTLPVTRVGGGRAHGKRKGRSKETLLRPVVVRERGRAPPHLHEVYQVRALDLEPFIKSDKLRFGLVLIVLGSACIRRLNLRRVQNLAERPRL